MLVAALVGGAILLLPSTAYANDQAPQTTYTVVQGDTLSEIGQSLNIPWEDLAELNGISAPYIIYPDQVLQLTSESSDFVPSPSGTVDIHAADHYNLGPVKSHVKLAAAELGPKFHIKSIGGFATSGHAEHSDHYTGLALDLMVSAHTKEGKTRGDALAAYAIANRKRLHVKYVIWDRQIWTPKAGWHTYHVPVNGSDHTDHVHISFLVVK